MALTDRHDRIYPASELWIALRTAWIDYRKFRRVSFDEICLALTSTYERSRKFRFQHIVEASRNQLHSSW